MDPQEQRVPSGNRALIPSPTRGVSCHATLPYILREHADVPTRTRVVFEWSSFHIQVLLTALHVARPCLWLAEALSLSASVWPTNAANWEPNPSTRRRHDLFSCVHTNLLKRIT